MAVPDGDWRADAACIGVYPEIFFPTDKDKRAYEPARRICAECPVRLDCLDDALRIEGNVTAASRFGMHGGLTPQERAKIQPRRQHPGDENLANQRARRTYETSATRLAVAEHARAGMGARTIAETLGLQPVTVFHHLRKLRDADLIPDEAGRERAPRGEGAA